MIVVLHLMKTKILSHDMIIKSELVFIRRNVCRRIPSLNLCKRDLDAG